MEMPREAEDERRKQAQLLFAFLSESAARWSSLARATLNGKSDFR